MPIIGWDCPACKRKVPLDHYDYTICGLTIHPDYANSILHLNDDRYVTDTVTVTSGLGCPRSRAIEESDEIYANPFDYNSLLIGTAWDRLVSKHAPPDLTKVHLRGKIAGLEVQGEVDRVRRCYGSTPNSYLVIEDWKHTNNYQHKYLSKDGAKPEYIVQTSIYAELFAQQFGERPTHGAIWYHFSGANKSSQPVLLPFVYLLKPIDECLAFKPYNGAFTVEELYRQSERYYKWKTGQAGIRTEWYELPLVGETMSFGAASFCDYCAVRAKCFEQAKGAPF